MQLAGSAVLTLARDALGGAAALVNTSVLMALPSASTQGWHADGGHLSLSEHLPCHCLNVFVPLVDMGLAEGPTEYRPGSHMHTRDLARLTLLAKAKKTLRPPVAPRLRAGSALLSPWARECHEIDAQAPRTATPSRLRADEAHLCYW